MLAILMVLLIAAGMISQTAFFRAWVRDRALDAVNAAITGTATVGALEGNLFQRLVVEDLKIVTSAGPLVSVDRITAEYRLLPLLTRRRLVLRNGLVEGLSVNLAEDEQGWNVAHLVRQSDEVDAGGESSFGVELENVEVHDSTVDVSQGDRRYVVRDLNAQANGSIDPQATAIELVALSFKAPEIELELRTLSGAFRRSAAGDLRVQDVMLQTAHSRLRAGAEVRHDFSNCDLTVEIDNLSAAEIRRVLGGDQPRVDVAGTIRVHGSGDALVVDGTALTTPAGSLRLDGRVDALDPRHSYDLAAQLEHVNLHELLGPERPTTDLTARLSAQGDGVTWPDMTSTVSLDLEESVVAGSRVAGVSAHAALEQQRLTFAADMSSAAGEARAEGRADLAAESYQASIRMDQLDPGALLLNPELGVRLSGTVELAGKGFDPNLARADAVVHVEKSEVRTIRVRRLDGQFSLDRARLAVAKLELDANVGRVSANGSLELGDVTAPDLERAGGEIQFTATIDDLRPLAQVAKVEGLAGQVSADGRIGGRWNAIDATANLRGRSLAGAGARVAQLNAEVQARGLRSPAASAQVHAELQQTSISGRTFARAELASAWKMTDAPLSTVSADVTVTQDDRHRHRLAASARLSPDHVAVAISEIALDLADQHWTNEGVAEITRRGERVNVSDLRLRSGSAWVSIDGDVGTVGKQNLSIAGEGIEIDTLSADGKLAGRVDLKGELTGSANAPQVQLDATIDRPTFDQVTYQRAAVHVEVGERRAGLSATLVQSASSAFKVEAQVPLVLSLKPFRYELGDELAGTVRAEEIDIAFLDPMVTQVSRLTGRLSADLSVAGALARPRVTGEASLAGGRMYVMPTGVLYEPITVRVRLDGETLQLDTLQIASDDGALTGDGRVQISAGAVSGGAAFQLKDFELFRNRYGEGSANGLLRISGSSEAPVIEGNLETNKLIFKIPERLPGAVRKADPTIRIVGRDDTVVTLPSPEPEAPPEEPPPALYDRARVHIEIRVPRDAWLRRSDAEIELRGNITADKQPGEPLSLAGQISAVRGWYAFQGRKFTVEEGEVTLTGQGFDPLLDIVAVHQSGDYTVRARIGGKLTKPTIKLESEPALDQADILSVLLFGKPASELNQGEANGLRTQALGVASNYVAGEFRRSVADALGLDTLEVEPSSEGLGKTSASIGKYISEDIFVSLSHKFAKESVQQLTIQYFLSRQWTIETSTDTLGNSGIDLFWRRRY